jgi:hypothetical protein
VPSVTLPALSVHRTGCPAPVAESPVHNDVDALDVMHGTREVVVQAPIAVLDHDQHPQAGQWQTGQRESVRRPQKLRQVSLAETVCFAEIVQRLALAEIGGRPFGPAPGADPFHGGLGHSHGN